MKKSEKKQGFKLMGHYHVEVHESVTLSKYPVKALIVKIIEYFRDNWGLKSWFLTQKVLMKWCRGKLLREYDYYNLVPTVGLTAFAAQMSGDNTADIGDNLYVGVGDDATAPAAGDTTLGNETARKLVGSTSFAGPVASIAVFFAATEATGTHREFGLFGNGNTTTASASADSGILFSHVGVNVAVSATETLTITFELTFSN